MTVTRWKEIDRTRKCIAPRRDGLQCEAYALGGSEYCNFHDDPQKQREISESGGRGRAKKMSELVYPSAIPDDEPPVELKTPSDVLKLIEQTVDDVKKNRLRADQATMIAQLGNVALTAMRTDVERGAETKPLPEITEIARSEDPRAVGNEFPGSEMGETSN